jgi:hypothetical protein
MSNDAITTAAQNMVIAINNLNNTWLALVDVYGTDTSVTYAGGGGGLTQLIVAKPGRVVNLSVTVGALTTSIYNSATVAGIGVTNKIAVVDTSTTGIKTVNVNFSQGLVLAIPVGCSLNVTYSLL